MVARAQSPGITQVPIFGDRASSGSGPTPPSSVDRFEASIIVGNVLRGDPAVAQAAPFRYIPDPGDGSGIALALSEASAVSHSRIRVRPGQYTLTDAIPLLSVPLGCRLEGSGAGGSQVTSLRRLSGATERQVFDVLGELAHLTIVLFDPSAAVPNGEAVVTARGEATVEGVDIYVTDQDAEPQESDSLRSLFSAIGDGGRIVDCRGLYAPPMGDGNNQPTVTVFNAGVIMSGPFTNTAVIRGTTLPGNYASQVRVNATASNIHVDVVGVAPTTGSLDGHDIQARLTTEHIEAGVGSTTMLLIGGSNILLDYVAHDPADSVDGYIDCVGTRVTARVSCSGAINGIVDQGSENQWSGYTDTDLTLLGNASGVVNMRCGTIDLGALSTNCIAVANRVQAAITDLGTGNEVANNVIAP